MDTSASASATDDQKRADIIRERLQTKFKHQRATVQLEYEQRKEILALDGKHLIYPNQEKAANKIIRHYSEGKTAVCLIAQPGVGKTGVALELAYRVATHPDDDDIVDVNDIHTHCGMSDKEWEEQYTKGMLPSLSINISHRSKVKNSLPELSALANGFTNGLIITDEAHIASGIKMTQSNVLKDAGLLHIDTLEQKNIKLCSISATPEGIAADMKKWGEERAAVVILEPGPDYKGFEIMQDEQRIRDAPEINTLEDAMALLKIFDDRYAGKTKRIFPFRGLVGEALDFMRTAAIKMGWAIINHDSENKNKKKKNEDAKRVEKFMSTAPDKHTIIIVKNYWRASKRFNLPHIGGTYEKAPKKTNTSVTSQGLTARLCNNYKYENVGDWLDPNLRPLCFCDLTAIEEYLQWWINGCDYTKGTYTSTNIKSRNGIVNARKSLLHPINVGGLDEVEDTADDAADSDIYLLSELFPNDSDAKEWGNSHMDWTGDWNKKEQDADQPVAFKQQNTWKVNPCTVDGGPGNTHVRYGGKAYPIQTEEVFRRQNNYSRFGQGVRCVPLKTGDTLLYAVIYKASWLRI